MSSLLRASILSIAAAMPATATNDPVQKDSTQGVLSGSSLSDGTIDIDLEQRTRDTLLSEAETLATNLSVPLIIGINKETNEAEVLYSESDSHQRQGAALIEAIEEKPEVIATILNAAEEGRKCRVKTLEFAAIETSAYQSSSSEILDIGETEDPIVKADDPTAAAEPIEPRSQTPEERDRAWAKKRAEAFGVPIAIEIGVHASDDCVRVIYHDSSISAHEANVIEATLNKQAKTSIDQWFDRLAVKREVQVPELKNQEFEFVISNVVTRPFKIPVANDALGHHEPLLIDPEADLNLWERVTTDGLQITHELSATGKKSFFLTLEGIRQDFSVTGEADWKTRLAENISELGLKAGNLKVDRTTHRLEGLNRTELIEALIDAEAAQDAVEREIKLKSSLADAIENGRDRKKDIEKWRTKEQRDAESDASALTRHKDRSGQPISVIEKQNVDLEKDIAKLRDKTESISIEISKNIIPSIEKNQEKITQKAEAAGLDDWVTEVGDIVQIGLDLNIGDIGKHKDRIRDFRDTNYDEIARRMQESGDSSMRLFLDPPSNRQLQTRAYSGLSEDQLRARILQIEQDQNRMDLDRLARVDARLETLEITESEHQIVSDLLMDAEARDIAHQNQLSLDLVRQVALIDQYKVAKIQLGYAEETKTALNAVKTSQWDRANEAFGHLRRYYRSEKSFGAKVTKGFTDGASAVGEGIADGISWGLDTIADGWNAAIRTWW